MRPHALRRTAPAPAGGVVHPIGRTTASRKTFVSVATVHELLARAEARLPRDRQASDATRRAALGVACGVAEAAAAADLTADRPLWTVEVPEDGPALRECTGLSAREVDAGLALLLRAGVVERVVGPTARLRVAEHAVVAAPVLAAAAWAPLRAALRAAGVTVAPALGVVRAIAVRTAGRGSDGAGDAVALTQQELADATLFGRTAVVGALTGLVQVGALELAARRGTWTECRLLPALFVGAGYRTPAEEPARAARAESVATTPAVARDPRPAGSWDRPAGRPPEAPVSAPSLPPAGGADPTGGAAAVVPVAGPGLTLEVGGVLVPLTPGMSLQPPPGARLCVEVDPDGRRYLRIDAAIRVGPLP